MCGIVGIYNKRPTENKGDLVRMRDTMAHRGPDDEGVWWAPDGRLGLAQRRLSIIDLSEAGHQPMFNETKDFCIIFNGEIYNFQELRRELQDLGHHFKSRSDTEVLLEAYAQWGKECVQRLNGAFAFCLYDRKEDILFLARDRAGEKPLFYAHNSQGFLFASELKALMEKPAFSKKINYDALNFYLAYGYVPGNRCILEGVNKLLPAHALTFSCKTHNLKVWRYWEMPSFQDYETVHTEKFIEELQFLLQDSVSRQLVADVPVGILLSGGLDSSLVTALAARSSHKNIKTFTVTFPDHAKFDEGPYAKIVADHFKTDHTELVAEAATVELLPLLAWQYDEPLADSSMVPTYLVSKLIRQHCTVALGGDGGDELFGGYPTYNWIFKQAFIRNVFPAAIRNVFVTMAERRLPLGVRGRSYLMGSGGNINRSAAFANLFFDQANRVRLAPALRGCSDIPEQYKMNMCDQTEGLPGMFMSLDFQTYLPEDILNKVDRASMLNSLEVRAPFLDYRIIEFAFKKVPNSLRADNHQRKILLRHLGKKLLPAHLDMHRKQGFCLPFDQWIKGTWGDYMRNVLYSSKDPLFDKDIIEGLWKGQKYGLNNTARLFSLVMFELWRQRFNVRS